MKKAELADLLADTLLSVMLAHLFKRGNANVLMDKLSSNRKQITSQFRKAFGGKPDKDK